jgi:tetratricopeptide (TPR) repeat protein
MKEIPFELRNSLESGDSVLFVGAGIGGHLIDVNGKPVPAGDELAKDLLQEFSIDYEENNLAKVASVVEMRKGRKELENYLKKRLINLEPDSSFQWICSIRWKGIFTTNYDNSIIRAYELVNTPKQNPVSVTLTSEIRSINPSFEVPVYFLHGALFGTATPRITITEDDYTRFREQRRMLFEKLKEESATSTILYIGYSNRDSNWNLILSEISSEFFPSELPSAYRVDPHTTLIDQEILKKKHITTIDCPFAEFVESANYSLDKVRINSDKLEILRATVPSDLYVGFGKNPAAVTRLLASWTYVNQTSFSEKTNLNDFLRGERPTWSLLSSGCYFKRDIEDPIYEELIDYATIDKAILETILLTGSAGYGITTLLMTLAVKLVMEKAGVVLMLKPSHKVFPGDIEFAVSLFAPQRVFFIVDNAADYIANIKMAILQLKESKRAALFMLGERVNEWKQSTDKLRAKEFEINPLSDLEITNLLKFLGDNSQLNTLEPLGPDLQFAAIKKLYNKELLVVLRQTTEGKSFDAILEDEYNGIACAEAKYLYLTVCCFHQNNTVARDNVLAEVLGLTLPELYKRTKDPTHGVVVFECIDDLNGIYAARTRHRVIAEVVWQRCGSAEEKTRIIQSSINALNIAYETDRRAFDDLVKSDRTVDSIRSMEDKMKFFETACKKDPLNPYVRQHYARMLSREDKGEAALAQIDEAIKMNSRLNMLFHTKGTILYRLALGAEGKEIGLRRVVQSEDCFRTVLRLHPGDEYGYQGLAQLYRGWAEHTIGEHGSIDYIAKAEEIINEGLKKVRDKASLWIESSRLQELLGENPESVLALENAVRSSPGSVISRYLLGRAYRKRGEYSKAVEVLTPVIKSYNDEFRVFVEYATCLVEMGRPYREAIAVLRLSGLYGLSDPRYIATFGGMLFLDGQFSEAEKVFSESIKQEFNSHDMTTVQFRPPQPGSIGKSLCLNGKVVAVKAGSSLIETADYPRISCPVSKYHGVIIKIGLTLKFEIAFTPRGPVAESLQLQATLKNG